MTIINKETKSTETQSHRTANWMGPDWLEVPPHLVDLAFSCGGYCDLTIEDGVLVGITPLPIPEPEPVDPVMTTEEAMLDMMADHDYRLGLIELGGQN